MLYVYENIMCVREKRTPGPNVLAGLFALCERLFGVQIVAADGEAEVSAFPFFLHIG